MMLAEMILAMGGIVGLFIVASYYVFWPRRCVIVRVVSTTPAQVKKFGYALAREYEFVNLPNIFETRQFNPNAQWGRTDTIVVQVEVDKLRKSELGLVYHSHERGVVSVYVARLTPRRLRYLAKQCYVCLPESEVAKLLNRPVGTILPEGPKGSLI